MKKSKTSNNPQILSPENYIRQKSRNLPISKCYVNKDWDASKLCQATIVREHASGNVTACRYLVDLGCLGIKDTHYLFNVPWEDIEEKLNQQKEYGVDYTEASYELIHNIIYSALEFAEDYGFKPHRDFTSVTSYFLEEDTDDIPIIPVECGGDDGNPLYVNSGIDSPSRVKQILAQLDKTAGKGNYHYILNVDGLEEEDNEDIDEEEENEVVKDIKQMGGEERKKQFIELFMKGEISNVQHAEDEVLRMLFLCQSIIYDITPRQVVDKQLKRFESIFEHEIVDANEFPNSLFTGVQNMEEEIIVDLFYDSIDKVIDNKCPKKLIARIREKAGNVPVADFLELFHLKQKNSKKFTQKAEEAAQKFPDYFSIQLYRILSLSKGNWEEDTRKAEKLLSDEKQPITEFEAEFFFTIYLVFLMQKEKIDIGAILAFEEYIHTLDSLSKEISVELFAIINTVKMSYLVNHFIETGEISE